MASGIFRIGFGVTSLITGKLASISLPQPIQGFINRLFGFAVRIDMAGADRVISAYPSVQALFTRKLSAGARPVQSEPCSPADGTLSVSDAIERGDAIQAKGLSYAVKEFLLDDNQGEWAWQSTIYLAPKNYHRVHAPVSAELIEITHVPGLLWPVNSPCVERVGNLFCRNERLIYSFQLPNGGRVMAVMVAALNVGNMSTDFWPDLRTSYGSGVRGATKRQVGTQVQAGDEIGVFNLGSTVVIVFDRQALSGASPETLKAKRPILMGADLWAGD